VFIESSTTSVIEKSKSKRSLKAKGDRLFGVHILGVREGGRRGKGEGEGGVLGVCTSSKERHGWGCIGE
jgi:hypothetical protein